MLREHEERILALESMKELKQEEKLIELGVRPAPGVVEKVTEDLLKEGTFKQDIKTEDFTQKVKNNIPQENYKQSVDETERITENKRPIPSKGVSTTESGVGKSPVDIKNKKIKK